MTYSLALIGFGDHGVSASRIYGAISTLIPVSYWFSSCVLPLPRNAPHIVILVADVVVLKSRSLQRLKIMQERSGPDMYSAVPFITFVPPPTLFRPQG